MNNYICKKAREIDLMPIARCHCRVFPKQIAMKLGLRFVAKLFHWYLNDDTRFLHCVWHKQIIIGYLGGTSAPGSSLSIMKHTFWEAIIGVIKRPWLIARKELRANIHYFLRKIFRKKTKSQSKNIPTITKSSIGLIVIGVDPDYQRKGIGSQLLMEFDHQVLIRDCEQAHLTVRSSNKIAIKAYINHGWVITGFENLSTKMNKTYK